MVDSTHSLGIVHLYMASLLHLLLWVPASLFLPWGWNDSLTVLATITQEAR